ncbi:MAG: hypothetical protein JW715_08355, partial [Sedimentisphaerales bacterium]|nr:hypothetical protein [Sedimentisphaerales bacterium]
NKEGFRHLKEMTGLSNLGLSEVPEDELENLDEALPDCEIYASSVKPAQPPSLFDKSLPDMKDFGINLSPSDVNDKSILVCFFDIQQRPSRNCIIQLSKRAEKLKAKDFLHDFKSIIKNDRLK